MTFKEFEAWYIEKSCNNELKPNELKTCRYIVTTIQNAPFWKRKSVWKSIEREIASQIVKSVDVRHGGGWK